MITKDNTYAVMKIFFDSPEEKFHIREIARLTGLSPPGVIKILKKLKKENLLMSRKEKMVENVWVSKKENFFILKRCYNIQSIFESGLLNYLRDGYEEPEAIVLFGSYSRGEDISTSDIDISIITGKHLNLDMKKYEKKLKRRINLFEIKIENAEEDFLNELSNGVVISGYLKVIQ